MRKILATILSFFALAFIFSSCNKKDFDPGTTTTPNSSNGWWVTYTDQNGVDVFHIGTVFFSTYNTSANQTDSMWVDDLENFWQFKGKVALNYQALTFDNPTSQNVYYASAAAISNGKIMPLAGHSKTGVATDSIYMQIKFDDDDPDRTWTISGTARTGFEGDDY